MEGHQRQFDPGGPVRQKTAKANASWKRRRRQPARPNRWFALLLASVAADREQRGDLPDLSRDELLAWADAYHTRTGQWPTAKSGPIPEAPGETWLAVEAALCLGQRGFAGGSTILQFLAEHWRRSHHPQPDFTVEQILTWADAWYERTGRRPNTASGNIPGTEGINWKIVDDALRNGRADCPAGFSLFRLLIVMRGVFRHRDKSPLTEGQVLAWADAYHERTGSWPKPESGWIAEAPGEAWNRVDEALERGLRGLPNGSSLPRLLAERRGVRLKADLPPMIEEQILAWADAYHARHGEWPNSRSGPIPEAPGETWLAVQSALDAGGRGLPGGSSLTRLLVERRGIRNRVHPPRLTIPQILAWTDAYRARTGRWPTTQSGPIAEAPGETWLAIHAALRLGLRGLPGDSSLARLLARKRGVRNEKDLPPLTIPKILEWADSHHDRHGAWPRCSSGPIPEAPGEKWLQVHESLSRGQRGLPGGSSLARLLAERRGARNIQNLPSLSVEQILAWADAHHVRWGRWPNSRSGPIPEAPSEKWQGVQNALYMGLRGMPGGSSLSRLLAQKRGARKGTSHRQPSEATSDAINTTG